ncbi:MAG: GTP-sensing pleiotropic transcriptional regulator CodY [Synergistetes bacterium]|nr:GTP-sensing pleiotropic transcriptional regulator CodY [Synergistota bacterium]MDW8193022.1 GTP-sensing pleiotropic transcriptional regulator CodY [Synergistota bacterium]
MAKSQDLGVLEELLRKERKISRLVERQAGREVDFKAIAGVLSEVIEANVYISDKDGKILGYALLNNYDCPEVWKVLKEGMYPEEYNEKLLRIVEPMVNQTPRSGRCSYFFDVDCKYPNKFVSFFPIVGGSERLGTLVIARFDNGLSLADQILAEYGATIVGIEILRARNEEMEKMAREQITVQLALRTLSYSELSAMRRIFEKFNNSEGVVIASKIAGDIGVTRSVIVNALRKLESAGIIETRSLGMKGTYIRVITPLFLKELKVK